MKPKIMLAAAVTLGIGPAPLPLFNTAAKASAAQCMDQDSRLAQIVSTSKPPQNASVTVHMTNVMYVTREAIRTLDRLCSDEPDYEELRASYQDAYDKAEDACRALNGDPAICVPTRYSR